MPSTTINYSTATGVRFASALGKAHALMDTQDPPQPRSATAAECKEFFIARAWQMIVDIEGRDLQAAALAAVVVPPVDMT